MQDIRLHNLGLSQQDVKNLLDHFQSQDLSIPPEETIIQVIKEKNLIELVCGGVEESAAASAIIKYMFLEKGDLLNRLFRTRGGFDLYQETLAKVSSFSMTKYAKEKLRLWIPLPSSAYEQILERQDYAKRAADLVKLLTQELPEID
ncbi:MAG: hypothetical protein ACFFBD_19245, partial [Candidatus Hodarchaeota archaeon]